MNLTIQPDHFTYSNSHQHALACDLDIIMPIMDDLRKKQVVLLGNAHFRGPLSKLYWTFINSKCPQKNDVYLGN